MQQQLYETTRPNLLDQAVLNYAKHFRRKQHVEYRSIFLSGNRSTKIQGVNKKVQKKEKESQKRKGASLARLNARVDLK